MGLPHYGSLVFLMLVAPFAIGQECSGWTDCDTCMQRNQGWNCQWCTGAAICQPRNQPCNESISVRDTNDCHCIEATSSTSCKKCLDPIVGAAANCRWCPDEDTCLLVGAPCPSALNSCPDPTTLILIVGGVSGGVILFVGFVVFAYFWDKKHKRVIGWTNTPGQSEGGVTASRRLNPPQSSISMGFQPDSSQPASSSFGSQPASSSSFGTKPASSSGSQAVQSQSVRGFLIEVGIEEEYIKTLLDNNVDWDMLMTFPDMNREDQKALIPTIGSRLKLANAVEALRAPKRM